MAPDRDSICSHCSVTGWRRKAKIPQVGVGSCPARWEDACLQSWEQEWVAPGIYRRWGRRLLGKGT